MWGNHVQLVNKMWMIKKSFVNEMTDIGILKKPFRDKGEIICYNTCEIKK